MHELHKSIFSNQYGNSDAFFRYSPSVDGRASYPYYWIVNLKMVPRCPRTLILAVLYMKLETKIKMNMLKISDFFTDPKTPFGIQSGYPLNE